MVRLTQTNLSLSKTLNNQQSKQSQQHKNMMNPSSMNAFQEKVLTLMHQVSSQAGSAVTHRMSPKQLKQMKQVTNQMQAVNS